MQVALITGSGGLIGSEAAERFSRLGLHVVGIDNDMRSRFFGPEASTDWNVKRLESTLGDGYTHVATDIRDRDGIADLFARYGDQIAVIVHAAAQPSHDWAARDPFVDFDVNAVGTLNLLEATRQTVPEAPFIFCSTNKVYGDRPNELPLVEDETRWELPREHEYFDGITEEMSIDRTLHSVFGASKTAADVMVQEYGRYFGMRTACFRGGTLTGPRHSATQLHGFLGYVMRCAMTREHYTVFGYKGKQVRDAIHSEDLVDCFEQFYLAPRSGGEVYNIGGGRTSNCSVLEAIRLAEEITGAEMSWSYEEQNRIGDHLWWIGSNERFSRHYPEWSVKHDVTDILREIHELNGERWTAPALD